jgi:hypothetical protein
VLNEVEAFRRREELQRDRHELDDLIEGPWPHGTQERLQLCKRHLDGIEVGAVRRQEAEARADAFDRGLHLRLFVHGQVIEHDHIAGAERRREHLLDVREKRGIVDRAVEDCGRRQAVDAERRDDRVCLPVAVRRVIAQAHASRTPTVAAQEIRRDARFIDEDVGARIVQWLRVLPLATRRGHVRASLFVGVYRFF